MKDIPAWVMSIIETENLRCNKCKTAFKKTNLISIGIQESSLHPHNDKLCIGMYCAACKEITIFEIKNMSLVEFAFEILERETEPETEPEPENKHQSKRNTVKNSVLKETNEVKNKLEYKKSKITKQEIAESVRFLKSIKTHEDFLVAMGMSPEQICQYNYKKSEDE
jgi:hypothetical protein